METAERAEPEDDGGGEVVAAARSNVDRQPGSPTTAHSDDDQWSAGRSRSEPGSPGGAVCVAVRQEREAVALEEGHRELASSVSDTLSSAESVCETEAHRRAEQGGDLERRAAPWRPLPPSGPEPEPSAGLRRFPDEEDEAHCADEDEGHLEEAEERRPEEPPQPPLPRCGVTGGEALSDISSESCPDLAPDDVDECLRVEIAAASSDSETDEKWRAVFSSSINKEDDDSYLDALHLSARELFVHKVQAMDPEDDDQEGPAGVPGAEGRSPAPTVQEEEDRRGRAPGAHGARAPDRRLPIDFCVIQETASDNVSTEHVDFRSARQQWRAMEEQSNNKALVPAARQPQPRAAGHARTYAPPVRNMERAREAEPPAPQFSPCSEDSGLDDCTPRSPEDEAQTPAERETGGWAGAPPPALVVTPSPGGQPPRDRPVAPGQRRPEDPPACDVIVRSASELSLDGARQPQEKMFPSNPFFKLRSRSSVSLVDEEIRVLRRREEELRQERARLYGHGRPADKRMLSGSAATLSLDLPASSPMKCKSSPSSPMKSPKMERSALSCDHRFAEGCGAGRRKSAMALRWEAGHFAKNH